VNNILFKNFLIEEHSFTAGKGKGKVIPVQPWTGPEGSSMLRLTDFKSIGT
jgi:hypothetical protein